jgi:trehalose utilization protein
VNNGFDLDSRENLLNGFRGPGTAGRGQLFKLPRHKKIPEMSERKPKLSNSGIVVATSLFAVAILGPFLTPARAGDTRVLIWDERQPEQKQAYDSTLGEAIGEYLQKQGGFSVKYGTLEMPDCGLEDQTLDATDVLIWWGHRKHAALPASRVEAVVKRVTGGRIGLIALHSSNHAQPFLRLMEERVKEDATKGKSPEEKSAITFQFLESPPTGVPFIPSVVFSGSHCLVMRPSGRIGGLRADGLPGHVRTLLPDHPIAMGLPKLWVIPKTEMFNEPFHVPEPDAVMFEETWELGERFRSGCVWCIGKGNVFYFRPGHETYPVYLQEENLRVIENAAAWLIDNR